MTGFTHVHLPLISDYSQVLSAWQDSLVSIYHSSFITREYKSALQELLISILNSSACNQSQAVYFHVAQAQHVSYLQIFSRHKVLLMFFCKLECELYCTYVRMHACTYIQTYHRLWKFHRKNFSFEVIVMVAANHKLYYFIHLILTKYLSYKFQLCGQVIAMKQ